jgi:hydroxymethylglutaryl-CoA lyase
MSRAYPRIVYTEEVMREGMQIEDAAIPLEAKIELLEALSDTGLQKISVGSFVSPKYTPQMADIDELMRRFKPRPGVTYTALALNAKGVERAREYAPPLTISADTRKPTLFAHQCDVFVRRNANRSQAQEIAAWPRVIEKAVASGATEAGISTNASFGSNFLGDFPPEVTIRFLEHQHHLWDEVGIKVTSLTVGDPMGWCHPVKVEAILGHAKRHWPEIDDFRVHLHNSRGMAMTSAYAAIVALDGTDTLHLEGTLGGIGGCPYCGNGRGTGMAPTEDFMHMLEGMGIDTGVDLDKLIDCVWMLEKMIGRMAWGHVSRTGPRPYRPEDLFDPNAPFVETLDQARHFKLGPAAYEGGIVPWKEPIASPYLARVRAGRPAYDADGPWPWEAGAADDGARTPQAERSGAATQ